MICAARTLSEGDHPLEGSLKKTVSDIKNQGGGATGNTDTNAETFEINL